MAINAIKNVPANNGNAPNAFCKSLVSRSPLSLTNTLWGDQLRPNKKSVIGTCEKNFKVS